MAVIIQPSARIVDPGMTGVEMLKRIETAARISHRSEDGTTDESYLKFIEAVVMKKGDWSVTEHVSLSVDFTVDRGISHQIVRHRLFSYTQESTRFVNYEKKMEARFIYPHPEHAERVWAWDESIDVADATYKSLLRQGWRPQEARSVLPNALACDLRMTGNLRTWRWFLLMRTTKETHPQMRQVTIPLLEEFKRTVPLLYDDIIPNESQAVSIAKKH